MHLWSEKSQKHTVITRQQISILCQIPLSPALSPSFFSHYLYMSIHDLLGKAWAGKSPTIRSANRWEIHRAFWTVIWKLNHLWTHSHRTVSSQVILDKCAWQQLTSWLITQTLSIGADLAPMRASTEIAVFVKMWSMSCKQREWILIVTMHANCIILYIIVGEGFLNWEIEKSAITHRLPLKIP